MGKNIARPGRVTLARSVLFATGIYHATAIPLSKWARDKINRIARTSSGLGMRVNTLHKERRLSTGRLFVGLEVWEAWGCLISRERAGPCVYVGLG
jgi:hypothetical protein